MPAQDLTDALLQLDCATRALVLGRGDRSRQVREAHRQVRQQVARLAAAQRLAELEGVRPADPLQAVEEILQLAAEAGVSWPDLVATVNRVRESRP